MHIPEPSFTTTTWREGYDIAEVDAFVSEVSAELKRLRGPDPALTLRISRAMFTPRRLRASYDMSSVDEYLDVLLLAASQGPSRS